MALILASVGCRGRAGKQLGPSLTPETWANAANASTCASAPLVGSHRTYEVGPGKALPDLDGVPWMALEAGDVVNIYFRPEPYRTKIGLRASGTEKAPVVINGVTDAECHRPVIDGKGAATAHDAARESFFSEKYSEFLGAIFIYRGPQDPYAYKPRHIQIRNLKITGAAKGNPYTSQAGRPGVYSDGAGGIYAIVVEHLLVENCEITGNGNGVFVNTRNDTEEDASRDIVIRRNLIYRNGTPGSYLDHNLYVQAQGVLYEGNYIGQLVGGAEGSSLKDRSSGTVVRYNRIDAAARALDLVESEGGGSSVVKDPNYNSAWVYGNLIIDDLASPGTSSELLIHWGGDNNPALFRRGTLHFYYNTVVTRANRHSTWRIHIFDLPTDEQRVEARGNIFFHGGDTHYQLLAHAGVLDFVGTNWIEEGWEQGREGAKVHVNVTGKLIEGADPGFRDLGGGNFTLNNGSPAIDAGDVSPPPELAAHWVGFEYRANASPAPRTRHGAAYDLGAFEF